MSNESIERMFQKHDGRTDDVLSELWDTIHRPIVPGNNHEMKMEKKAAISQYNRIAADRNLETGFTRHVIIKVK